MVFEELSNVFTKCHTMLQLCICSFFQQTLFEYFVRPRHRVRDKRHLPIPQRAHRPVELGVGGCKEGNTIQIYWEVL